jgi:hypothetical protein
MTKPKFTPPTMKEKGNEETPETIQGTNEENAHDQEKSEEELQAEADREAEEMKKAEEERIYKERLESARGEVDKDLHPDKLAPEVRPLSDTDIKNGLNAISAAIDGEIKRRQKAGEKWRQLKKVSDDLTAAVFHARGIDNGGKSPRVQS